MSKEESQKQFDELIASMPQKIKELELRIKELIKNFNSFDLLANISFYNHLHSTEKYNDYREDKMFVISELVSLFALQDEYRETSLYSREDWYEPYESVQKIAHEYVTLKSFISQAQFSNSPIEQIASKTYRDENTVRNPGFPEHHFEIVEELYKPIEDNIYNNFGFTIAQSVCLRKKIQELINKKYFDARSLTIIDSNKHIDEILEFKNHRIEKGFLFSNEELIKYSKYEEDEIRNYTNAHFGNELHYELGTILSFTNKELSDFAQIDIEKVDKFLSLLSCDFNSKKYFFELFSPENVLKSKPIIHNRGRYLIPSMPLLTWSVEPIIENFLKRDNKLQSKFKDLKHDYLLETGLNLFSKIFSNSHSQIYPPNLSYPLEDGETDGLILYDTNLFIIEAKGHRFTNRAKKGKIDRTQKHIEEIVKESYDQGVRTIEYLKQNDKAFFYPKGQKKVTIDTFDIRKHFIISLTIEPLGHLTPLIKATNEIEYFNKDYFPLIISLYDLIVLADHIESPSILIDYIERRSQFLLESKAYIYEEMDILSYYFHNRLDRNIMFGNAEGRNATQIYFDNETDRINDYYFSKYGYRDTPVNKMELELPEGTIWLIKGIEKANFKYKSKIVSVLLEFSHKSIEQLMSYIIKLKSDFEMDKKLHDCSIYTEEQGGIGFTFMTGINKNIVDERLYKYCYYKLNQLNSKCWIGIGDVNTSKENLDVKCLFIAGFE